MRQCAKTPTWNSPMTKLGFVALSAVQSEQTKASRRSAFAAIALAALAAVSPKPAHAREYPWCLSREGYLYCFYETQQQCQWTASGIGGCALNPRLLFPNKP